MWKRLQLAAYVSMVLLLAAPAVAEPGAYFIAIHCDPHFASDDDWDALVALVEAADLHNQKLTIQLNPQWSAVIGELDSGRAVQIVEWVADGHEIGGHHHTVDHAGAWDGYAKASPVEIPKPFRWPGYLGDMQDYMDDLHAMLPEGIPVLTISSKDYDFPFGAPFQTGGSYSTASPTDSSAAPIEKLIEGQTVWNLKHAALIAGGSWQLAGMMAAFDAAGPDVVFGATVHPQDYYPGYEGPMDTWFDFLASRDPDGTRSRTAGAILEDHVSSIQVLPLASSFSLMAQGLTLLGAGLFYLRKGRGSP